MVGDTLHTDILGANSFGLKSILMTKYGLLRDSNIGEMIKKQISSPIILLRDHKMLLKKVDDLTLKDINFSYKKNFSSQKILENFNYVIKKGKFTSIIGPSGSGKTSLLKLIAGLNQRDSGQIKFENKNGRFEQVYNFSSTKYIFNAMVKCSSKYTVWQIK